MLQSLLQPRENQRSKMIGAMPAVAVRHERRRNDKRAAGGGGGGAGGGGGGGGGRRPSQLPLQLARAGGGPDATPSPPRLRLQHDLYVCGKVALLHGIVGAVLLGVVLLVVGLVQLSPGAEAAQHRYYLMGAGAALTAGGLLAAVLRCICLHWFNRKYGGDAEASSGPSAAAGAGAGPATAHKTAGAGTDAHKAADAHRTTGAGPDAHKAAGAGPDAAHKHKLKTQASVTAPPDPARA